MCELQGVYPGRWGKAPNVIAINITVKTAIGRRFQLFSPLSVWPTASIQYSPILNGLIFSRNQRAHFVLSYSSPRCLREYQKRNIISLTVRFPSNPPRLVGNAWDKCLTTSIGVAPGKSGFERLHRILSAGANRFFMSSNVDHQKDYAEY